MKTSKLYSTLFAYRNIDAFSSKGILVLRAIAGFGLVLHGLPKLMAPASWMGDAVPSFLQFLATLSEFGGGLALLLGLLTPLASMGAFITMLTGVVLAHVASSDPLYRITVSPSNEGPGTSFFGFPLWLAKAGGHSDFGSGSAELAILYLIITFALFFTGPGKYSVDYYIKKDF